MELHQFEKREIFEGCMPVEVMAKRGIDTLRYGPLKPMGFTDPRTGFRPYALVQLRQDNKDATIYNIVGFQTNLKFGEQKRVFSLIPGLKNAEFVKSMFDRKGGRVTELVAKPMMDILFPDMYKFSQPLSGMIAGRKELFLQIEFEKDYGVDIGILLDVINLGAKVQEVHIGKVKNVSQQLQALNKMAKEVMIAILKRANY